MNRATVGALLLLLATSTAANAIDISEIYQISSTSFSFGTARSSGMGGAFTSLGADGSSAMLNPAGLGMYSSSDFSVSLAVQTNKTASTAQSTLTNKTGSLTFTDKVTNVPLSNFTSLVNIYNSKTSPLRAVNLAFSYNLLDENDYSQTSATPNSTHVSRLSSWGSQLQGISPSEIAYKKYGGSYSDPYLYQPTDIWGAMMAFNSDLIFASTSDSGTTYYNSTGEIDGEVYSTLASGDYVYPELYVENTSRKTEYNFSAAVNLLDKLFLGFNLSSQDYAARKITTYSEVAADGNSGDLDYFDYTQILDYSAYGFSFKAGATYTPIKGLRVAVAYHAPTILKMSEAYSEELRCQFIGSSSIYGDYTPENTYQYQIKTPTIMLTGISYTIGKYGIVSFDYNRTWYNKMRYFGLDEYGKTLNSQIETYYKATNNYRVGVEGRINSNIYLRAGYAYYGGAIKGAEQYDKTQNISGGAGFRLGHGFYLDFSYTYSHQESATELFYNDSSWCDSSYYNIYKKQTAMFTLGSRF